MSPSLIQLLALFLCTGSHVLPVHSWVSSSSSLQSSYFPSLSSRSTRSGQFSRVPLFDASLPSSRPPRRRLVTRSLSTPTCDDNNRVGTLRTRCSRRIYALQSSATVDDVGVVSEEKVLVRNSDNNNSSLDPLTTARLSAQEDDLEAIYPEDFKHYALSQKVFNAIILSLSFGYAAYTIFNIDHGLTRGWSQAEIAMRIPLDTWNSYELSLAENPVYTKTLINVVIYLLGDWLSQTLFQKKDILDFDASRTLRNGFIGLCFGPLVHEYYQFSDSILPPDGGVAIRMQKILMDQTIYLFVKCSAYIAAVGFLNGDDASTVKNTVETRIGGIMFTAWKFWPLVHCITYGVIPPRHRILWVNSIDLIWNAILASMSQKQNKDEVVEEQTETESLAPTALTVEPELPQAPPVVFVRNEDSDTHQLESLYHEGEKTQQYGGTNDTAAHMAHPTLLPVSVGNATATNVAFT